MFGGKIKKKMCFLRGNSKNFEVKRSIDFGVFLIKHFDFKA